jgi:hypothetical protein
MKRATNPSTNRPHPTAHSTVLSLLDPLGASPSAHRFDPDQIGFRTLAALVAEPSAS